MKTSKESPMPNRCNYCKKKPGVGNKVSHSNRKSKRLWLPNIQTIRIKDGSKTKKVFICTKCLKAGKGL